MKTFLQYSYMEIEEIPDSVYKKYNENPNINNLSVGCNKLTRVDPRICMMTRLKHLYLFGNFIEQLPPEIGNLVNLISLVISDNLLTHVPPEISKLTNLQHLDLNKNNLTRVPVVVCNLANLRNLDLSENDLTCIPHEIGNLTNIRFLNLSNNNISSISPGIANIENAVAMYTLGNPIAAGKSFSRGSMLFPACRQFLDKKKYLMVYLALAHSCNNNVLNAISINYPLITMDDISSFIPHVNTPYEKDFHNFLNNHYIRAVLFGGILCMLIGVIRAI